MKKQYSMLAWVLCFAVLLSALSLAACRTVETGETDTTGTIAASTEEDETTTESVTDPETEIPTELPSVICNDPDLVYTYTDEMYGMLCGKVDRLYELLTTNDRQEEFLTLYEEVEDNDYETLMDQYNIAQIRSMMYTADQAAADCLADVSEKYNRILQRLIEMYDDIDASAYAEAFFQDWTPEERAQAVASAGMYTDELTELKVASDKLITEYRALPQDDEYMKKSAELYMRAIEMNNRMASISGYENYMEYAYELIYDRDYTPGDVSAMRSLVKEKLAPMLETLYTRLTELGSQLSQEQKDQLLAIWSADLSMLDVVPGLGESSAKVVELVDSYLDSLGGDIRQHYYDMWNHNRYILASDSEVSHAGAFSAYLYRRNASLFYFGPGYQGLFTVMHEYGHCYAMDASGTIDIPLDLAEVHSQGNEWLFLSFLNGKMQSPAYEYLVLNRLVMDVANICNCLAVNDFEVYVYTHDDYTAETLDRVMRTVMEDLGVFDSLSALYAAPLTYWHYVAVDNPGYYISYTMSLLPSLELYAMSLEDYQAAVSSYRKLSPVGQHDTFLGKLAQAGIGTPFASETYDDITAIPHRLKALLYGEEVA